MFIIDLLVIHGCISPNRGVHFTVWGTTFPSITSNTNHGLCLLVNSGMGTTKLMSNVATSPTPIPTFHSPNHQPFLAS